MENANQNDENLITDKQRQYISDLVLNKRVDGKHKHYIHRALQNTVTRLEATAIINFLLSTIEFKKNFVGMRNGTRNGNKPASKDNVFTEFAKQSENTEGNMVMA